MGLGHELHELSRINFKGIVLPYQVIEQCCTALHGLARINRGAILLTFDIPITVKTGILWCNFNYICRTSHKEK